MVEFKVSKLISCEVVVRPIDRDWSDNTFNRTCRNLNKMISEGRSCKVISPIRPLSKQEIEEYRRFFCKKAKEDKVNYIYFTVPVKLFKKEV